MCVSNEDATRNKELNRYLETFFGDCTEDDEELKDDKDTDDEVA